MKLITPVMLWAFTAILFLACSRDLPLEPAARMQMDDRFPTRHIIASDWVRLDFSPVTDTRVPWLEGRYYFGASQPLEIPDHVTLVFMKRTGKSSVSTWRLPVTMETNSQPRINELRFTHRAAENGEYHAILVHDASNHSLPLFEDPEEYQFRFFYISREIFRREMVDWNDYAAVDRTLLQGALR